MYIFPTQAYATDAANRTYLSLLWDMCNICWKQCWHMDLPPLCCFKRISEPYLPIGFLTYAPQENIAVWWLGSQSYTTVIVGEQGSFIPSTEELNLPPSFHEQRVLLIRMEQAKVDLGKGPPPLLPHFNRVYIHYAHLISNAFPFQCRELYKHME